MEAKKEFSKTQKQAIEAVKSGKNVFITGPPGTGKSFLVRELVEMMGGVKCKTLGISSSTGQSAIAVGGCTLHSFGGIGLGKDSVHSICSQMNRDARQRWKNTKRLIIDEISMISGELFDKLENVARVIRASAQPFGGIQLVIVGDFYQLPPVKADKYAFESEAWKRCIDMTIVLDKMFRQTEGDFIDLLQEMRIGKCSEKHEKMLQECAKNEIKITEEGIVPTKLYPHRARVIKENNEQLALLTTEAVIFNAYDTGRLKHQLKECPAEEKVVLKKGAQVILLKNLDLAHGLGNGTRGVIIDFVNLHLEALNKAKEAKDEKTKASALKEAEREEKGFSGTSQSGVSGWLPVVKFENGMIRILEYKDWTMVTNGEMVARRDQIPLALAYAISIHRSQGQTLSFAEVHLAGTFERAQAYTAISRLKSLQGLKLIGFEKRHIMTDDKVIQYYESLTKGNGSNSNMDTFELRDKKRKLEKETESDISKHEDEHKSKSYRKD